jgi:hypothetical protein
LRCEKRWPQASRTYNPQQASDLVLPAVHCSSLFAQVAQYRCLG